MEFAVLVGFSTLSNEMKNIGFVTIAEDLLLFLIWPITFSCTFNENF